MFEMLVFVKTFWKNVYVSEAWCRSCADQNNFKISF